jgi:hypothetical protein
VIARQANAARIAATRSAIASSETDHVRDIKL